MHVCPNCGREFEGNFCPSCGKKREEATVCPSCGAPLKEGDRFCPSCGCGLNAPSAAPKREKPAVNAQVLKKVFSILPIAVLGVAVAICFALFAAPVAVDAFAGESQGSIYRALLSTGDDAVMWDIRIIDAACMLVLFTALCAVFTLCALGALLFKPLHKTKEFFNVKFSLCDLFVFIALAFMIVVFALARTLWTATDEVMGGGLGLFKEGGCTIGVSVVTAIFFCLAAGAETAKLVLSRKFPSETAVAGLHKDRFMSTLMMWFALMFSLLCFVIFLFPVSYRTATGENMGSIFRYCFGLFSAGNDFYGSDGNTDLSFARIFIQTFNIMLPVYMIMIVCSSIVYLLGGSTRRMDRFSYTTVFVTILAIVCSALSWQAVPAGYTVGMGTVTLVVVAATGLAIQIVMLVLRRIFASKEEREEERKQPSDAA